MFKIVQTVEDEDLCLTIVPSKWEKDGILHWPKKRVVTKLVRDGNSEPGIEWTKMACVVKRTAATYLEAEDELASMEMQADTDQETTAKCDTFQEPLSKKQRFTAHNDCDLDLNELLQSTLNNGNSHEVVQAGLIPPQSFVVPELNPIVVPELPSESIVVPMQTEWSSLLEQIRLLIESMTVVQNNQAILERNQANIVQAIARVEAKIDFFTGEPDRKTKNPNPQEPENHQMKPINSKEELDEFEKALDKGEFKHKVIEAMTFICGTTGRAKGINCAYKLVDFVFTRLFLTMCSWTGGTRTKADPAQEPEPTTAEDSTKTKVPFKFYTRTLSFFLTLVNKADSSFSEMDAEKFFKVVLKNSVARLESKQCTSTTKKRPANLTYKVKQPQNSELSDGE